MSHMPTAILEPNLYEELLERIVSLESYNEQQQTLIDALMAGTVTTIVEAIVATYDVRAYGLVANSAALADANRSALQGLCDIIKATGKGGRVYFPEGKWWIGTKSTAVLDDDRGSIMLIGHNNLTFSGDGVGSRIIWTGNLLSTAKYLFWARGAGASVLAPATTENITFENLYICAADQTNLSEHNHLLRFYTQGRGDVKNIVVRNCHFGWTNGDCINLGGFNSVSGQPTTQTENVRVMGCTFNGFDTSEWTTTPPTGGYRACLAHQSGVHQMQIIGNWMTGSDDSLIDYEPSGTQQGNIGAVIMGNTMIASSPSFVNTGTPAASYIAVAFGGEGETDESNIIQDVIFSHNVIRGGRLNGLRMARAVFDNNTIVSDTQTNPEAVIDFSESLQDVSFTNNKVFVTAGCGAIYGIYAAGIDLIADSRRETINLSGNTVSTTNGNITGGNPTGAMHGIYVESCNARINGNRVEHRGTLTNVSNAITWKPLTNGSSAVIANNEIVGDAGGGTLQYGVTITPDGAAVKACTITGNAGTGCQTGGVRASAPTGSGAYTTWPVIADNSLPGGVVLGSGVYAQIGGNRDGITHTVGGNVDPNGVITAIQGSTHVRRAGDATAVYRKTTGTSNTGWVTP